MSFLWRYFGAFFFFGALWDAELGPRDNSTVISVYNVFRIPRQEKGPPLPRYIDNVFDENSVVYVLLKCVLATEIETFVVW